MKPTRTVGAGARLLVACAGCALGLVLIGWRVPRPDLVTAGARLWLPLLAQLALCSGLFVLLRWRGQSGLGAPHWVRWLAALGALATFHFMVVVQAQFSESSLRDAPAPPRDCLALGLFAGGLFVALLLRLSRHGVLTGPAASGALAGCSAGYAALAMLQLHCASELPMHLHVVHGLPLLLLAVLGAAWGKRALAVGR